MRGKNNVCFMTGLGLLTLTMVFFSPGRACAQEDVEAKQAGSPRELSLKEFIDLAVKKDTEFERILIDELALRYEKDLQLPAKDLVLEVKSQYDFFLGQDREAPENTVSLSRLFPFTGTDLSVTYKTVPSYGSNNNTSDFTLAVSQPIAQNAFGKATRLKDKIVGLEVDIARHQIIEAYEDYLASLISGYYDWYQAYANLEIGESSYRQNMKLLDNIIDRQKSNIALPVDVNKVHLQVLAKKEKLVELKDRYARAFNFIEKAIRWQGEAPLLPQLTGIYSDVDTAFEVNYKAFKENSRTYQVLDLLEEKSGLRVDEEADDLLPSVDLLLGYNVKGKDLAIKDEDNMLYAGVSLEWPLGDQVDRAEFETSRFDLQRTRLANKGLRFQLYTDIKDLSFQMQAEEELLGIAKNKIDLAREILEAETENYSFGKVSLNDYIDAVNVLDTNRFNEILHDTQYKKLLIEWLRLTDQLVDKNDVRPKEINGL